MQRRDFIGTMSAGVMASRSGLFDLVDSTDRFSAWTRVHGGGEVSLTEWRARYTRIRAAGITGVLVGGGDRARHAEAAHAAGLVLHRWTWALNRNGDTAVQEAHPEWFR